MDVPVLTSLYLIGILLLFSLSASLLVLKVGPLIILQPRRFTTEDYRQRTDILSPADLHLPFVDISVYTRDGMKLAGWFVLRPTQARGTIIYLHGLGDNKISGLPIAKLFHDHHYNICLFDSRRHGDSEGGFCTYGYHEKWDVGAIISALERSYGARLGKIGLFGASMGAAVALQEAEIDPRVAAVVAEACFTDLRTISLDYQKRLIKVRWKFLGDLVMRRAERLADFEADQVSPLKAVEAVRIPLLFVHGTRDSFIDHRYSEILYQSARDPKEVYFIKGAYHNDTWAVGGSEYVEKLLSFFDRWLSPTDSTSS